MAHASQLENAPRLIRRADGKRELEWPREHEIEFVLSELRAEPRPSIILITNIDAVSGPNLVSALQRRLTSPVRQWRNVSNSFDFVQTVIASYLTIRGCMPMHIGLAFIKHSRLTANSLRVIEGPLQRVAKAATKIYGEDKHALVTAVLNEAEVDITDMDAASSQKILDSPSDGEAGLLAALQSDYEVDADFRSFLKESIFLLSGTGSRVEAAVTTLAINDLSVVFLQETKLASPAKFSRGGGVVGLGISAIGVDAATDLIRPIWQDKKFDNKSDAFVRLIVDERAKNVSASAQVPLLGEAALSAVINTIRQAVERSSSLESVLPEPSPIDAEVINGRLELVGNELPESGAPVDVVEEFRLRYYKDARRISEALIGTNAGRAFTVRLDATTSSLSQPLTKVSSLILGDQVRALEVMFPSVSEVLSDVTASDLGAFVSGLGLLVRQFPSWRDFLEEARGSEQISEADSTALDEVIEVLNAAPAGVVDVRLIAALGEARSAREAVVDRVLDLAFVRSVSNVLRAIGRYTLHRTNGVVEEFDKSIEKEAAKFISTSVIAVAVAASTALLHLAVGLPLDFGWIVGLGFILKR